MSDGDREDQPGVAWTGPVVRVEEAATILGLSHSTVLGLVDIGALTIRFAGDAGEPRISRAAVTAYHQTMVDERRRALDEIVATSDELGFSEG